MALFVFTRAILAGEPIAVFNNGRMRRDFTYIDDIVEGGGPGAGQRLPGRTRTGPVRRPDPGKQRGALPPVQHRQTISRSSCSTLLLHWRNAWGPPGQKRTSSLSRPGDVPGDLGRRGRPGPGCRLSADHAATRGQLPGSWKWYRGLLPCVRMTPSLSLALRADGNADGMQGVVEDLNLHATPRLWRLAKGTRSWLLAW